MCLIEPSQDLSTLLDRVARIAAVTAKSPIAIITLRIDHRLCIIGTHGIYLRKYDDSWEKTRDLTRRMTMSFIANVQTDPNFRNHPLLKVAPFAKSLAHIPVQGVHSDIEAAISVINPELKWPFSASISAVMTDLAMLVGDALKATEQLLTGSVSKETGGGFRERKATALTPPDTQCTAGKFLFTTLPQRTSIRNRKDVSYLTLRTWSKPIKEHQLNALKIVKESADLLFIDAVAAEMAEHVRRLFGVPRVSCVIPVPGGHAKTIDSFSVQLARRLSVALDVPFLEALSSSLRKGTSHPRKNAALLPPELLVDKPLGSVLLVDDVATSGRHIELAVKKLRSVTQHVSAIAWIGAA